MQDYRRVGGFIPGSSKPIAHLCKPCDRTPGDVHQALLLSQGCHQLSHARIEHIAVGMVQVVGLFGDLGVQGLDGGKGGHQLRVALVHRDAVVTEVAAVDR